MEQLLHLCLRRFFFKSIFSHIYSSFVPSNSLLVTFLLLGRWDNTLFGHSKSLANSDFDSQHQWWQTTNDISLPDSNIKWWRGLTDQRHDQSLHYTFVTDIYFAIISYSNIYCTDEVTWFLNFQLNWTLDQIWQQNRHICLLITELNPTLTL